jgi:hypothetical protein
VHSVVATITAKCAKKKMAVNSFDQVHAMAQLSDDSARTDLLNRLKRAEGQLRGVQRMIEAG